MDFEATRCGFSGCYAAIQRQKRAGEHERGRSEALQRAGEESMKGKSRRAAARGDIMRFRAANQRRKERQKQYDRTEYDGSQSQASPIDSA